MKHSCLLSEVDAVILVARYDHKNIKIILDYFSKTDDYQWDKAGY